MSAIKTRSAIGKSVPGKPKAAADKARNKAIEQLQVLFTSLFDSLEDYMLMQSEKAAAEDQSAFFSAGQVLKGNVEKLTSTSVNALNKSFAELSKPAPKVKAGTTKAQKTETIDLDSLGVVENDDLAERVVVDTMISKARRENRRILENIEEQLSLTFPGKDIQKNNPLDPTIVIRDFSDIVEGLNLHVKAKAAFFHLFDDKVVALYGRVIKSASDELQSAGYVVEESKEANKGGSSADSSGSDDADSAASGTSSGAQENLESGQNFSAVQDMMAHVRATESGQFANVQPLSRAEIPVDGIPVVNGGVVTVGGAPVQDNVQVQVVQGQDLMNLLSQVQQAQNNTDALVGELLRNDVKERFGSALHESEAGETKAIQQADEDTLNLISMMFDFILDDKNLPVEMKALIGRLQIPIIRVAIKDKSFFSNTSHIARRLLNIMARAGVSWNAKGEPEDESLEKIMDGIVQRILTEFDGDLALFEELFVEFRTYVETTMERARAIEERTLAIEEGQSKTAEADLGVHEAISQRMAGRELPPLVVRIIQHAWSKVLRLTWMNHGEESKEWKLHVRLIEVLIWSVQPIDSDDRRHRLKKMAPNVYNTLKSGLKEIAFDSFETKEMLVDLNELHKELIREGAVRAVKVREANKRNAEVLAKIQSRLQEKKEAGQQKKPAEEKAVETEEITATKEPGVDSGYLEVTDEVSGEIEEVVLVQPGTASDEVPEELASTITDEEKAEVKGIKADTWFEISDEEDSIRLKVAANIKTTERLIFVNRRGVKVKEMSHLELALALKSGMATLIEEGQIFDQALESVIANLRASNN